MGERKNLRKFGEDIYIQAFLNEACDDELLTREEEITLARKIKEGREALEKLAKANVRLVVSIAKLYIPNEADLGLLDLVQEGNMGLMRSAEGFIEGQGAKFSTYAYRPIEREIRQAIARGRKHRKNKSMDEELPKQSGTGDNEKTLHDVLPDKRALPPPVAMHRKLQRKMIKKTLSILGEKERKIVMLFYGLGKYKPHTTRQIARREKVGQSAVIGIIQKALKTLKKSLSAKYSNG